MTHKCSIIIIIIIIIIITIIIIINNFSVPLDFIKNWIPDWKNDHCNIKIVILKWQATRVKTNLWQIVVLKKSVLLCLSLFWLAASWRVFKCRSPEFFRLAKTGHVSSRSMMDNNAAVPALLKTHQCRSQKVFWSMHWVRNFIELTGPRRVQRSANTSSCSKKIKPRHLQLNQCFTLIV